MEAVTADVPPGLPAELGGRGLPPYFERDLRSLAILAMMRVNGRLARPQLPIGPAEDVSGFRGLAALERSWTAVRDEWSALHGSIGPLPTVDDLIGRDPGWDGTWQSYAIRGPSSWFAHARASVPATVALLEPIQGLVQASFSVLRPGTYLRPHRGPNTGVIRALLGLVVPEPDRCGMLVGDRRMDLREGELVAFDDTFEHAAWNRGSSDRVALLLEVRRPLSGMASTFNRASQRAFRHYPMVVRGNRSFEDHLREMC